MVCQCPILMLPPLISLKYAVDGPHYLPHAAEIHPSYQDPKFRDGSEPLFTMYSRMAEEEDDKMVRRWRRDADGILIFVRPCVILHTAPNLILIYIGWTFLCYPFGICFRVGPGPQAKLSRYRHISPRENSSASR